MKPNKIIKGIDIRQYIFWMALVLIFSLAYGCEEEAKKPDTGFGDTAADDASTDVSIQEYILRERIKTARTRFDGDTLDLMQHILDNYEPGSYLADIDNPNSNVQKQSAVIYVKEKAGTYVFAMIVKSIIQEKLVEAENFIGYDASFVDYDSTKLGTAGFYLTLFKNEGKDFTKLWETLIPASGGFNNFYYESWGNYKIPSVRCRFYNAVIIGADDYSYFLVNGIESPPHLLNTYDGFAKRRRIADINKDSIPDYYEWSVIVTDSLRQWIDSTGFIWKDSVYVNTRNPKQKRKW